MFMFYGDNFHELFLKSEMKQWSSISLTTALQANKTLKLNLLIVKGRKSVTTNRKVCSSS